ncbi:hypothetical protein [Sphingomonas sp. TX0522]|uniref:hypothetical protein n=1 Tax=Sphingomonas sp. TX0522 TaxID=2479205 RepID=UPI0018DF743B|nr:hypothetical protein [Sphingomonas sp. TX0522]MBI0530895.1 hypothetical protein [Sphingomonas sp. TX0522]
MTPANQSTPEVTRADTDSAFLYELAGRLFHTAAPTIGFDQNDSDVLYRIARDLAKPATPARGGDELREALDEALALIQEAKGLAGPGSVTDHLDFAESWLDKITAALASTDTAGADHLASAGKPMAAPDRLARRMGAEFIARDDVPQVEGLTSGEGLRALSDRATAGPWAWEQCGDKEDAPVVGIAFPGDDPDCKAPYEGEFRDSDASRMTIAYDWQWCDGNSPSANAAFAVACVNYVRAMLAASPKAAATASVREDCAAACDRIATGSVYIGESEEGRARHEGIIAGARNCAAAIRRLTDSGTAATIGGERA